MRSTVSIEVKDENTLGWLLYLLGQRMPDEESDPEGASGWAVAAGNPSLKPIRNVFLPDRQDPDDPSFIVNVTVNDQNVVNVTPAPKVKIVVTGE